MQSKENSLQRSHHYKPNSITKEYLTWPSKTRLRTLECLQYFSFTFISSNLLIALIFLTQLKDILFLVKCRCRNRNQIQARLIRLLGEPIEARRERGEFPPRTSKATGAAEHLVLAPNTTKQRAYGSPAIFHEQNGRISRDG